MEEMILDVGYIAVLDTGGDEARAIARRLRAMRTLAVVDNAPDAEARFADPALLGVILAGNALAAKLESGLIRAALACGRPLLALGKSARAALMALGACPGETLAEKRAAGVRFLSCPLFEGVADGERYFERVEEWTLPPDISPIAESDEGWHAGYMSADGRVCALLFSVESNDPDGTRMIRNFAESLCASRCEWTMPAFLDSGIEDLRARYPDGGVTVGFSGGAPSAVAAALAVRALGERANCVLCETGLLRKGEAASAARAFEEDTGVAPRILDISGPVRNALSGVRDAQARRQAVTREILFALTGLGNPVLLGAGREEGAFSAPLTPLFREEIKQLGALLGLSPLLTARQPFPASGLAGRVDAEATEEKIRLLREADSAFSEEIEQAGLDKKLYQYFVTLAPDADGESAAILHAIVTSEAGTGYAFRLPYDLIERSVMKILRPLPGIGRVLYDVTGR